ncbi:MAG: metallophosphoesterase [Candidatus Muiribacteriota bacterium]
MKNTTLDIILTNDLHGNFLALNASNIIKQNSTNNCISVDTGDLFSRFYSGELIIMKTPEVIDFWLPGNHDLSSEIPKIRDFVLKGNVKKIISNVKPVVENDFIENVIIEIDGVKIGIFGITTYVNSDFFKFKDTARTIIENVKKLNDVDFIILLSHLGINEDRRIAETVPEVDLILGGHSHTRMTSPELYKKTLIFHAGGYGELVGKVTLCFNNKKLSAYSGQNYNVSEFKVEESYIEEISNYKRKLKSVIFNKENLIFEKYSDNVITHAVLQSIKHETGIKNIILNSSLINPVMLKGKVTFEDLKYILGYHTDLYIMSVSMKDIEKVLKRSTKDYYTKLHFIKEGKKRSNLDMDLLTDVVVTDFLAQGGHHGGSMFPEFRFKDRIKFKKDPVKILADYLKNNFEHIV